MPDIFEGNQPSDKENDEVLNQAIEANKGKSVEELAKGKAHADQFIELLKEQNASLKSELDTAIEANKRQSAERAVADARARQEEDPPVEKEAKEPTGSVLTPEAITSLVKKGITEAANARVLQDNLNTVEAKVSEAYGDKAKEFVEKKATELNLSVDKMKEIAATSPSAFFNLVGMGGSESAPPITKPTVRTDALPSGTIKEGTNAYYQELRRKDKALFFSPQVQAKMFKDRQRLGDNFYK